MTERNRERPVRPVERQPMKDWLSDKLNGKEIPGLEWVNRDEKIFKIKWCHGSRHGWSLKDTVLFEKWAQHSGRHHGGDPKRWKANFRCALNSLKDVEEVKSLSTNRGQNAFKVYKMLDARKKSEKPKAARPKKTDAVVSRARNDSRLKDQVVKLNLPVEPVSDLDLKTEELSNADMLVDSESEGYQTDPQEDSFVDSAVEPLILPSAVQSSAVIDTETVYTKPSPEVNIPNFDKIIPDFYKIETEQYPSKHTFEFGKNHLLRRHGAGFKVDILKQQEPLTPILQPFNVPLQKSQFSTPRTASRRTGSPTNTMSKASSVTRNKTSLSSQQTVSLMLSAAQMSKTEDAKVIGTPRVSVPTMEIDNNTHCLIFPETPEGSEASHDSSNGEFVEVTIYQEEVTDTPMSSAADCIVLADLSKSTPLSLTNYTNIQDQFGTHMSIRTDNSRTYNPLTPP